MLNPMLGVAEMSIWSDNEDNLWMHSEEWAKVEAANKKAADENPINPWHAGRCNDTGLRFFSARWVCGTDTSTVIGHTYWSENETVYNEIGDWGEGVYWDAEFLPTYVDENDVQYRSMESYLASREPPAPRPKSKPKAEVEVTPRKKAEPKFNPFRQPLEFSDEDAAEWRLEDELDEWECIYSPIDYHVNYLIQESVAELSLLDLAGETSEADMVEHHLNQLMELRLTIESNHPTEGDEEQ